MITLRQLEIFVEAVRAGSFRQCAERLRLSAVAVSEHVRSLEAEIGEPLFVRHAGLLPSLTPAGQRVYDKATVVLADVADLRSNEGAGRNGRRRMPVALHTYLMRDLPQVLAKYSEAWPRVELNVDLAVRTNAEFADLVARRELDLAYCFSLHDEDVPNSVHVRGEPLGIYVGAGHRFAARESVSIEEIAVEPAVQLSATEPLTILIDRLFGELGAPRREVGLANDQFGLIVSSLRRNFGYGCLFANGKEASGEAMGLTRVKVDFVLPPLQVRRITRRSADNDPALHAFWTCVEERWAQADREAEPTAG